MALKIYRTTEAELIQGCLRRDRKAQKRLYDTYAPNMYTLCCRYARDAMEAEDILIRSFTKILDRLHQFRGEGSLEGWIRKVVIHEALSHLRKNQLQPAETDLEAAHRQPDYQNISDHLEAEDLLKMIGELPPGYRTVFNLYAIDGFSHKEIAEQLQISESTSKSQLSRARSWLQKLLSDRENLSKKVMP